MLAVDLRAHGDGVARLGRADAVEIDGHVGDAGRRIDDGHRSVGRPWRGVPAACFCTPGITVTYATMAVTAAITP